jgi:rubrerythrin
VKSYIKAIIIFNEFGKSRMVHMHPGVNIVTGESKTGKSALVEIMDYCLCSSRCTIPKGKITDFSYLYVMPMLINHNTYVIARYNWDNGGKMFVIKENEVFPIDKITLEYFSEKPQLALKNAQYEIEAALGLYVTNVATDGENQKKKASLRNMVSYLFQHQNLMASKFALFYRFTDFYKRKDIIDQFPIFSGMIGQEYYSDLIELGNLKTRLKKKLKIQKANEKSSAFIKEELQPLLQDYYSLLGIPFNSGITVQRMLKVASNLPEFDDSQLFNESGITERYHQLNKELDELRDQERDVLLKIDNLDDTKKNGAYFNEMLEELNERTNVAGGADGGEYVCPLCGNECEEISKDDVSLLKATAWLDNELKITSKYTADFSEDVRKLKGVHTEIENQIKNVFAQIKTIERKFINSKELVSKREKVNYAKARILLYSEMIDSGLFESVDEDIKDIKDRISQLEMKINNFDLDAKKARAQTFLSDNMNRLAATLDFEEEYRPINLNFGLVDETFDIYQYHKQGKHNEKIFLYEMGSGANWVSCHIALFLSFLRYFASQDQSPMPLTMFFDQPSQVYFPQGTFEKGDKDELSQSNLKAVNQMYKTIFNEINSIGKDTGILPQILIVDHVDGNDLEIKKEFASYVRKDWRNGEALI